MVLSLPAASKPLAFLCVLTAFFLPDLASTQVPRQPSPYKQPGSLLVAYRSSWAVQPQVSTERAVEGFTSNQVGNFRVHRHVNTPLGDGRADQIIADGLEVLRIDDDGAGREDVSCPIDLRRDGPVRTFNIGDGNVNTQAEKNAIFRSEGHVYVVTALSVCGNKFNTSIIGCSAQGLPLIVELLDAPQQQDGILWMHEYGHNRGRGHRPRTGSPPHTLAVMYPSISPRRRQVNQAERNDYQVPITNLMTAARGQEQPGGAERGVARLGRVDVREFVRQLYPEGVPYEQAIRLRRGAVKILLEMLRDPREAPYWTNVVTTLGMIGSPEAVDPLISFLEGGGPASALPLAEFRARLAVTPALGYILAKRMNGRALKYLSDGLDPAVWSQRVSWRAPTEVMAVTRDIQLTEMTIWGLALSGRAQARAALNNFKATLARESAKYGTDTEQVLSEALEAHTIIARAGLSRYYAR